MTTSFFSNRLSNRFREKGTFWTDSAGMDDVFIFAVFDADGTIVGEARK